MSFFPLRSGTKISTLSISIQHCTGGFVFVFIFLQNKASGGKRIWKRLGRNKHRIFKNTESLKGGQVTCRMDAMLWNVLKDEAGRGLVGSNGLHIVGRQHPRVTSVPQSPVNSRH